jgi:GNAT superfamily N-acetyltransferase
MERLVGDRARTLLERVLRGGGSLAEEFPLVFGPRPSGRLLALEEDGQVLSACALLVRDLVLPETGLRVGLIGSVATDPAHRGRGLATQLLAEAEEELAAQGCLLALLWADDPSFYEQRGWRRVGHERDFVVPYEACARLPAPDGVRAAAPDDRGAIHRLYSLHRHRVDRSARETAELLACPGMEVLVVQRSRDVIAYSCLGRGADLGDTVHEWAGARADVLRLVRAHLERAARRGRRSPVVLMTPSSSGELHHELDARGLEGTPGVLGHGKLLDAPQAASIVARLAGPAARFEVDGAGRIALAGPAGERALDPAALLDLLMPARGERRAIEALARATGLSLERLPLRPWLWGLDSI